MELANYIRTYRTFGEIGYSTAIYQTKEIQNFLLNDLSGFIVTEIHWSSKSPVQSIEVLSSGYLFFKKNFEGEKSGVLEVPMIGGGYNDWSINFEVPGFKKLDPVKIKVMGCPFIFPHSSQIVVLAYDRGDLAKKEDIKSLESIHINPFHHYLVKGHAVNQLAIHDKGQTQPYFD